MVKTLDEFRGLVLVIVAGYEQKMKQFFFDTNPGLHSRFPNRIFMSDYKTDELWEIFENLMNPEEPNFARPEDYLHIDSPFKTEEFRFGITNGQRLQSRGVPTGDNARRKVKATFALMKDYDNSQKERAQKAVERHEKKLKSIRAQLDELAGADYTATNSNKISWLQSLLNTENTLHEKESARIAQDQGLFTNTNARGVRAFFGNCRAAWSARSYREKQRGVEIERLFIEADISKATYAFTRQMLGYAIDYVNTQENVRCRDGEDSDSTVEAQGGDDRSSSSLGLRRPKKVKRGDERSTPSGSVQELRQQYERRTTGRAKMPVDRLSPSKLGIDLASEEARGDLATKLAELFEAQ